MSEEEIKLLNRIDYGFLRIRFNQKNAKKCEDALKKILKENQELRSENDLLRFTKDNPGIWCRIRRIMSTSGGKDEY